MGKEQRDKKTKIKRASIFYQHRPRNRQTHFDALKANAQHPTPSTQIPFMLISLKHANVRMLNMYTVFMPYIFYPVFLGIVADAALLFVHISGEFFYFYFYKTANAIDFE